MGAAFLESITLARTLPCLAEPGKIIVGGSPSRSLADASPYLASLPNVIIDNPHTLSLTLPRQPGLISLDPEQVRIMQVLDAAEGIELLGALTAAINATWDHRAELSAATGLRRAPRPLDGGALLPQPNCKACGEATCMAFTFGLVQTRRKLGECRPLSSEPAFADRQVNRKSIFQD